jgi:hypothetical protein
MNPDELMRGLPGAARLRQGLADFQSGQTTIDACLVGIARTRLRRSGVLPANVTRVLPDAELCLYRLLRLRAGDAYARYNALVRELVSFEQALDLRYRKHRASVQAKLSDGDGHRGRTSQDQ